MATNVTDDIEAQNNNSSGQQDGNNVSNLKLTDVLAAIEFVEGITAVVLKPPSSDEPVYTVAVVTVIAAGIVKAGDALWASRNAGGLRTRRRRRIIQFICIAAFILGTVLDVYACKFKK